MRETKAQEEEKDWNRSSKLGDCKMGRETEEKGS